MSETVDTDCRFYYDLKTRRRLKPGSAACRRNLARPTSLCDQCGQAAELEPVQPKRLPEEPMRTEKQSKKDSPVDESLPETLVRLRGDKKLSRRAAAEGIGVSLSSLINWESGRFRPRADQLDLLISFYKDGLTRKPVPGLAPAPLQDVMPESKKDQPPEQPHPQSPGPDQPGRALADLNACLFRQLERLNCDGLGGAEFDREISRSRAMAEVSREIIANAALTIANADYQGGK